MGRGARAVGAIVACAPNLAGFARSSGTIGRVDTIVVRVAQVTFRPILALVGRATELAGVGVAIGVAPARVALFTSLAAFGTTLRSLCETVVVACAGIASRPIAALEIG